MGTIRTSAIVVVLSLLGAVLAEPVPVPDGRYVCNQGGLTSQGTYYWGYFDITGEQYQPYTGEGGTILREADDLIAFGGGLFEYYDWVGVLQTRDDGVTEVVLLERADLEAFRAGESTGGGSGYTIYCGWDGTR